MSVLATLQQLSPLVLEQINQSAYTSETSAKIEVFGISHKISNPVNWELGNLISVENINVLKSRQVDVAQMVKTTQAVVKSVQFPTVYLGGDWADISIFLTGGYAFGERELSYIVSERGFDDISIPLVNTFEGHGFEKYDNNIYQAFFSPIDVKAIAEALTIISQNFSEQWQLRWEKLEEMQDMAAFGENDEEDFAELFNELVNFYQDTATHNNAVFITIC